jgi:hypothetical protein
MDSQVPMLPKPDDDNPVLRLDAKALLDFIAAQNQNERDYFDRLLKWFGGGILLVVAVIAFFGFQNYSQVKQIRADIENETRVQLGAAVKAELTQQKVEGQIGKALQQMAAANLQTAINNAVAAELDKPERGKLIYEAVNRQVGLRMAPRRLSEDQKSIIAGTLISSPPTKLLIQSGAPQEQRDYARGLYSAIQRSSSWKDRVTFVEGATMDSIGIEFDGIVIWVRDPKHPSQSVRLLEVALQKATVAGVRIESCNCSNDDVRLFVGAKLF